MELLSKIPVIKLERIIIQPSNHSKYPTSSGSSKNFKSQYCGKIYKSKNGISDHLNSQHTRKKLFQCDKCPMS